MKGISTRKVVEHFVNASFFNYCYTEYCISVNGVCFMARYFLDVCILLNVNNRYNIPYNP